MARQFVLISIPEDFKIKFNNLIKNINKVNSESEGLIIEEEYGEKPEYMAIPKKDGDE
jgi:hypothetical protein